MAETYHPRGVLVEGYRVREHPLYMTWADMKSRCNNPNQTGYKNYGGRGITYCERWAHFVNFVADMGPKPFADAQIDRVNNEEGYSPENCKWSSRHEQTRNRRKFKNNTSGETGIVYQRKNKAFHARYDHFGIRYGLGNFNTIEEAVVYRKKFIDLFETGDEKAFDMLERRANRNSSTGIRGVSIHPDGGYIVRKTVNKERVYLGYTKSLSEAVRLLAGST